ncbi:meiosis protein mei2 [Lasallia pustulata]|uniref:Meiosis protein mei2 n=1 Tax=Lasallia pustulata TaxID=136370 RepID=A0A1W5CY26_9LECA|nr:meiosis protein mei2 [Lasallia pustulata]
MESHMLGGHPGSPRSSAEADSHHGTPETKFTAFSPEEEQNVATATARKPTLPPAFALHQFPVKADFHGGIVGRVVFGSNDPFLSTSTFSLTRPIPGDTPKLSPTASSFTPLRLAKSLNRTIEARTVEPSIPSSISTNSNSTVSYLTATSVPDTASSSPQLLKYLQSVAAEAGLSPIANRSATGPTSPAKTLEESSTANQFSSDVNTSRSMIVTQIDRTTPAKELSDFFSVYIFPSLKHLLVDDLVTSGTIYVNFTDIRDTTKAYVKIRSVRATWNAQYLPAKLFASKLRPDRFLYTLLCEGQVIVKADFSGPRQRFDSGTIGHLVKELLENYGEVMAYESGMAEPPLAAFRAEYYDVVATEKAVAALDGFRIGGCTLSIMYYQPDLASSLAQLGRKQPVLLGARLDRDLDQAFEKVGLSDDQIPSETQPSATSCGPSSARPSLNDHSPASRRNFISHVTSTPSYYAHGYTSHDSRQASAGGSFNADNPGYALQLPSWMAYGPGAIGQERGTAPPPQVRSGPYSLQHRGPARMVGRQNSDYTSGHHNVVDVERIRRGLDVRTTIMLRNIPNKIDQAMLKDIVDETSHGKYDFMYLRIDFANNCNVGYAFINFEDPWYIIDVSILWEALHRARINPVISLSTLEQAIAGNVDGLIITRALLRPRRNRYNSDKVAEVSYATIQGKDCLVQKFRNSSVMLEHPSFRPKIFHTGSDSLAGLEDTFPGPDNPSKMRRSVENAEHVGLFAPRAGQHFRDEQRRRRSQYDRGTRLAAIEDSYSFDDTEQYGAVGHQSADRFDGLYGRHGGSLEAVY